MVALDVLEIIATLVVEIELPTVWFVRPVMVSVSSLTFQVSLIDLISFTKTAKSFLILFPINEAQSQHVISDNKVLVKFMNLING